MTTHAEQLVRALRRPPCSHEKRRWTSAELDQLRAKYSGTATPDIASSLGRTVSCVRKMAQSMGLKKDSAFLSLHRSQCAKSQTDNRGRFKPTHGLASAKNRGPIDPTYSSWLSMHQRCGNDGHKSFADYGGRGIKVDGSWSDFEVFRSDMGERPHGTTLGRIDNAGDYTASNCRWETVRQQQRNRRSNRLVTALGKTMTLVEWSESSGIKADTISYRIKAGWSPDAAVTTPAGFGPDGLKRWKVVRG